MNGELGMRAQYTKLQMLPEALCSGCRLVARSRVSPDQVRHNLQKVCVHRMLTCSTLLCCRELVTVSQQAHVSQQTNMSPQGSPDKEAFKRELQAVADDNAQLVVENDIQKRHIAELERQLCSVRTDKAELQRKVQTTRNVLQVRNSAADCLQCCSVQNEHPCLQQAAASLQNVFKNSDSDAVGASSLNAVQASAHEV
jgi:cytochrome c-type biogenesis protein CcmH/NrfG